MEKILMILIALLLFLSFLFQIRDIYIARKYKKTRDDRFKCDFLKIEVNEKGYSISKCENVLYNKQFEQNHEECPVKCDGRIFAGTADKLKLIYRTDRFYSVKKMLYLSITFLGTIWTVLNILDKI